MGDGWLNYPVLGNEVWHYGAVFLLLVGAFTFYLFSRLLLARLSPPGREEMVRRAVFTFLQRLLRGIIPLLIIWASLRIFLLPPAAEVAIDRLFVAALTVFILYLLTRVRLGCPALWAGRKSPIGHRPIKSVMLEAWLSNGPVMLSTTPSTILSGCRNTANG